MSTDTKALIAATPATVALVRRELDKSRESQRGGMQCGIPKAAKVDCAMVERLCRIAEKQADRLAELEVELASLRTDRDGAAEACRMLQEDKARLEQDNARLREALAPVANSHTDNEGTDRPVWWILDPQQMMRACPHRLYSMFHGPFWSREEAERFFKATRYRYGSRAVVYCGSAHKSPQMRELFDCSAASRREVTSERMHEARSRAGARLQRLSGS